MRENDQNRIKIPFVPGDFPVEATDDAKWNAAEDVLIKKYWSGEAAPAGRRAKARILWSPNALHVRFEARQSEPLVVSQTFDLTTKAVGLWDRDVCEIFVAPDAREPHRYFEFEVAPTGEWLDLAIRQTPEKRETDFDYHSGMRAAARVENGKIKAAIKIPWRAFGAPPKPGDLWLGNLYRCVGAGETRGYLAWRPTLTPQPNFHAPRAFGEFEFAG